MMLVLAFLYSQASARLFYPVTSFVPLCQSDANSPPCQPGWPSPTTQSQSQFKLLPNHTLHSQNLQIQVPHQVSDSVIGIFSVESTVFMVLQNGIALAFHTTHSPPQPIPLDLCAFPNSSIQKVGIKGDQEIIKATCQFEGRMRCLKLEVQQRREYLWLMFYLIPGGVVLIIGMYMMTGEKKQRRQQYTLNGQQKGVIKKILKNSRPVV